MHVYFPYLSSYFISGFFLWGQGRASTLFKSVLDRVVMAKYPPGHGIVESVLLVQETERPQALKSERPALSPDPIASLGLSDSGQVTVLCELLIPHLEMKMIIPHSIL